MEFKSSLSVKIRGQVNTTKTVKIVKSYSSRHSSVSWSSTIQISTSITTKRKRVNDEDDMASETGSKKRKLDEVVIPATGQKKKHREAAMSSTTSAKTEAQATISKRRHREAAVDLSTIAKTESAATGQKKKHREAAVARSTSAKTEAQATNSKKRNRDAAKSTTICAKAEAPPTSSKKRQREVAVAPSTCAKVLAPTTCVKSRKIDNSKTPEKIVEKFKGDKMSSISKLIPNKISDNERCAIDERVQPAGGLFRCKALYGGEQFKNYFVKTIGKIATDSLSAIHSNERNVTEESKNREFLDAADEIYIANEWLIPFLEEKPTLDTFKVSLSPEKPIVDSFKVPFSSRVPKSKISSLKVHPSRALSMLPKSIEEKRRMDAAVQKWNAVFGTAYAIVKKEK